MANTSQDFETFTKSMAGLKFNALDSYNHSSLYKHKQSKSSLDERRAQFLEDQKRKRFDYMNLVRDLTETDWYVASDSMECQTYPWRPRQYFHKDQLMLSEWLTEVPIDFEDEWLCVPCPMGKRCIVVASRGKTSSWTKAAYHIDTFKSCFPGGNSQHLRDSTILDCVYNKVMHTYYVLDLMSWRGQTLYDSETEFRFYWLHTKIQECPEILRLSKSNTALFVPLTSHSCTRESIYAALDKPAFSVEMDGVLFYHRRAHYTLGSTPLVGWLKPFMLPEIIDVDIPQKIRSTRPPNYVDYKTYIEKFNAKYTRRSPSGMFKKSQELEGNKGGPPVERERYVPREIYTRGQKKAVKNSGKEKITDETVGDSSADKTSDNGENIVDITDIGSGEPSSKDVEVKKSESGDMESEEPGCGDVDRGETGCGDVESVETGCGDVVSADVVSAVVNTVLDGADMCEAE